MTAFMIGSLTFCIARAIMKQQIGQVVLADSAYPPWETGAGFCFLFLEADRICYSVRLGYFASECRCICIASFEGTENNKIIAFQNVKGRSIFCWHDNVVDVFVIPGCRKPNIISSCCRSNSLNDLSAQINLSAFIKLWLFFDILIIYEDIPSICAVDIRSWLWRWCGLWRSDLSSCGAG